MSRYFLDNAYYFITVPTIQHTPFFDTPKKKSFILNGIVKAKKLFGLNDINFSIMADHYHLVVFFKNGKIIPKLLQRINGVSAYKLNKISGNKTPVWDEYYVYYIQTEEILNKIKGYVIGNPIKHKEIKTFKILAGYPYSSYRLLIKKFDKTEIDALIESVILFDDNEFKTKFCLKDDSVKRRTRLKSVRGGIS